MDRYSRGAGHYANVECAYAEFERDLVLSCNEARKPFRYSHCRRSTCPSFRLLALAT